ncbi:MAG: hypothetical protein Rubg2KO_07900 [Rubricoccaceae bacterium]
MITDHPPLNMDAERTFRSVWYRPQPMRERKMTEAFDRQRGRLTVGPGGLSYVGGEAPLVIREIESVDYGVHGANFNPSVLVRYRDGGESREAYFSDARYFGYAGFFGGTKRLAESIEHPGETVIETGAADVNKKLWIGLAIPLLILLVLQILKYMILR